MAVLVLAPSDPSPVTEPSATVKLSSFSAKGSFTICTVICREAAPGPNTKAVPATVKSLTATAEPFTNTKLTSTELLR